jgi:hypothetical protein
MEPQLHKQIAVVVDESLSPAMTAATVCRMTLQLGSDRPELYGEDVVDGDGVPHSGLPSCSGRVLRASTKTLRSIVERARAADVIVIDAVRMGSSSPTAAEYAAALAEMAVGVLVYQGVIVYGAEPIVDDLVRGLRPLIDVEVWPVPVARPTGFDWSSIEA